MSTNGSISPIAHAARVLADVLATVPDGAIDYAPIGLHSPVAIEYGGTPAYVTLTGPGAVVLMRDLGADVGDWYGKDGRQRSWTVIVKGVEFTHYETEQVPVASACVPA
jgi:hypothetical protein